MASGLSSLNLLLSGSVHSAGLASAKRSQPEIDSPKPINYEVKLNRVQL